MIEESTLLKLQIAENLCMYWSRENSSENKPVPSPQSDQQHRLSLLGLFSHVTALCSDSGDTCRDVLGGSELPSKVSRVLKALEISGPKILLCLSQVMNQHKWSKPQNGWRKFAFGKYKYRLFFQANLLQKLSLIRGSQGTFEFQQYRVPVVPFQVLFKGWQEIVKIIYLKYQPVTATRTKRTFSQAGTYCCHTMLSSRKKK